MANLAATAVVSIDEVEVNEGESDYVHGANLDSPRTGFTRDSYGLILEGWILSKKLAVEAVEVLYEERPVACVGLEVERPDIAAGFPEIEGAEHSGYRASVGGLKLADEFEIVLRAKLENGTRLPLARLRGRRRPLLVPGGEQLIQPLMVNTVGRSGSTLLLTLLSSHPDVVAFSPFIKDARVSTYWANVLQDLAEPSSFLSAFDPPDLEKPHWWLGKDAPELGDPELEHWLGSESVDSLANLSRTQIEAFYANLAGEGGARYFVEKYLPYQLTPDLLSEMYPRARELILVRDFRDMLCSVIAFNKKRGWEAFGRADAGSDAEYVETTVANSAKRLARRLRERGEAAHLVRYEDLVLEPAATLGSMMEFLGLEAGEEAVAATLERAEVESPKVDDHRTTDKVSASIDRWKRDLAPDLAQVCAEVLDPVLGEFGYEPTLAAASSG